MTGISAGSQGNQVGTDQAPIDPLLAPLGDSGGPTATMALLPGSPAIGGGTADGAPTTDQRGQPRAGHIDIGAFQSQGFTLTPVAGSSPQSAAVGQPLAHPLAVTVTAVNPVEPVDGGVVTFAAPTTGASAALSAASATIAGGQAAVPATANQTPGPYTASATAAGAASASFTLTNTAALRLVPTIPRDVRDVVDDLASLRAAIAYADSHPGPDTITFDPAAFAAGPLTITLTGGPLVLTDPATTTILGPGAGLLTLSGGGTGGVFIIRGGSVAIAGLTITGGSADRGGGLRNDGGAVALSGCTIAGNSAVSGGGLANDGGALTLTDCTVSGNTASGQGGGLANDGGALSLTGCVVSGNAARFGGGLFSTGAAALTDVLVRGNRARFGGGVASFGPLALTGVTIRGNTGRAGRGLFDSRPAIPTRHSPPARRPAGTWPAATRAGDDRIGGAPLQAPAGDSGGPTGILALSPGFWSAAKKRPRGPLREAGSTPRVDPRPPGAARGAAHGTMGPTSVSDTRRATLTRRRSPGAGRGWDHVSTGSREKTS
jgi:hypothetical protein